MKQFIASAAVFAAAVSAIPVWQQCGGQNWSGSGSCDSGTTCVKLNDCKLQYSTPSSINLPTPRSLLPVPAWQRHHHHHLGHQCQDYNHLLRIQDHDYWNDHKSLDDHRHYQQDKRRFDHHCASG